jgi:hypothetical protein
LEAQEWKLHTDIIAFENELRRFTARYRRSFELRDWYPQGRFFALLDQFVSHAPRPTVDRALLVTLFDFRLHKHWPWVQLSVQVATFLVSRASPDRTVIMVRALSDSGQAFVNAFLLRCAELWDATPLSPVADANSAVDERPVTGDGQKTTTISDASAPYQSQTERKKRTAHLSTAEKLDRLRAIRRDHLNVNRVGITFTAACNLVPIDTKTVNEHDPELRRHWDDPTYLA